MAPGRPAGHRDCGRAAAPRAGDALSGAWTSFGGASARELLTAACSVVAGHATGVGSCGPGPHPTGTKLSCWKRRAYEYEADTVTLPVRLCAWGSEPSARERGTVTTARHQLPHFQVEAPRYQLGTSCEPAKSEAALRSHGLLTAARPRLPPCRRRRVLSPLLHCALLSLLLCAIVTVTREP